MPSTPRGHAPRPAGVPSHATGTPRKRREYDEFLDDPRHRQADWEELDHFFGAVRRDPRDEHGRAA
jgi:hypothetical protein